jgi:hypothetical protein
LTPVPDDRPPEPLAVVTEAEAEMPLPSNPQTFFLGGIFALGVFATLYLASPIILPVVLAFVLKLLLQPAVRLLQRVHLPRPVGALLTVLLTIGTLVGVVAGLSVPAADWATKLPEGIPRLEAHLVVLKNPILALQKVIQQAEEVADNPAQKGSTIAVRPDSAYQARCSPERAKSSVGCLRLSWCSTSCWWLAIYSFVAYGGLCCRRRSTSESTSSKVRH